MSDTGTRRLRVIKLGFRGDGIAVPLDAPDADAWRVPGVLDGEVIDVAPLETEYGPPRGRLVRVAEPSPARRDPRCEADPDCRGCQLRHMPDDLQLRHAIGAWLHVLRERAEDALDRLAPDTLDADSLLADAIAAPPRDAYRMRLRARVRRGRSGWVAGLRARRGARVDAGTIDLGECPAQHPATRRALRRLMTIAATGVGTAVETHPTDETHPASGTDPAAGGGPTGASAADGRAEPARRLPDRWWLELEVSDLTDDGGVRTLDAETPPRSGCRVVIGGPGQARAALLHLATRLADAEPGWGVLVQLGDADAELVHGSEYLLAGLERWPIEVSRQAWSSAMPAHARRVSRVLEERVRGARAAVIGDVGDDCGVLELGCGAGTHAAMLASLCGAYVGVDRSRSAIRDAERNQASGRLPSNLRFRVGRAYRAVRRLASARETFGICVMHPMRRGMGEDVPPMLRALRVQRVIHVAPAALALAEDARDLARHGYRLERVLPIDTMPQTYHMMAVSDFVRQDGC